MSTLCLLTKELFWPKSYKEAQLYDFTFCWSLAPTEINGAALNLKGENWLGKIWTFEVTIQRLQNTDWFFRITKLFLSWEFFSDDFPTHTLKKKKVCYFWLFPSSRFRKIVVFQKTLWVPGPFIDSVPMEQKCPCWGVFNWNASGHQALRQMSLASMLEVAGSEGCGEPQRLPRIHHPQLLLALAMKKSPGPGFLLVFQRKPPKNQQFLYHYPTINNIHKFILFFFLEIFCSHTKYLPPWASASKVVPSSSEFYNKTGVLE